MQFGVQDVIATQLKHLYPDLKLTNISDMCNCANENFQLTVCEDTVENVFFFLNTEISNDD